jgi:putative addiction module component (TIGR02574 family)
MHPEITKLLEEALKLPTNARAALAGSLLESLDQVIDVDAEAAWEVEIERRLKELDTSAVQPIPWTEVRRRILGG